MHNHNKRADTILPWMRRINLAGWALLALWFFILPGLWLAWDLADPNTGSTFNISGKTVSVPPVLANSPRTCMAVIFSWIPTLGR